MTYATLLTPSSVYMSRTPFQIYHKGPKPTETIGWSLDCIEMVADLHLGLLKAQKCLNIYILYYIFIYIYSRICKLRSTLVISKSKELSEILRDIRTSIYQICRIEVKINLTTPFHK